MAGLCPGIREAEHPAAKNERTHKSLDTTGLLMEGRESNRRCQPFQGCLPTLLSGLESWQTHGPQELTKTELQDSLG
jgi:hypothetical protein